MALTASERASEGVRVGQEAVRFTAAVAAEVVDRALVDDACAIAQPIKRRPPALEELPIEIGRARVDEEAAHAIERVLLLLIGATERAAICEVPAHGGIPGGQRIRLGHGDLPGGRDGEVHQGRRHAAPRH